MPAPDQSVRPAAGLAFAFGSIVLVSMAQLLLKIAMTRLPEADGLVGYVRLALGPPDPALLGLIAAGLIGYGLSMYLWLRALGHLPLSHAYPLLSISFLLVYAGSVLSAELHEPVSALRLVGVALIIIGNLIAWAPRFRDRVGDAADQGARR